MKMNDMGLEVADEPQQVAADRIGISIRQEEMVLVVGVVEYLING